MLSPSGPRLSHELAAAHERARDVMSSGDAVCPTPQSGPLALTLSQTLHSRRARHAVWHQACGQVTDQSHAAAARSYTQEQLRAAAKMFEGMAMIQESMENKKEAIHFIQLALEAQELVGFSSVPVFSAPYPRATCCRAGERVRPVPTLELP
jgi:hypothetical protein